MRTMTRMFAVPVALLLAAGLTACGDQVPVTSSNEGSTSSNEGNREVESQTDSVMKLEVGDCFNYNASQETVSEVDFVSCDDPHQFEVYNNSDITAATLPVGTAMEEEVFDACYEAFELYVGVPYEQSSFEIQNLQPTVGSWANGDRTINCLIISQDGSDLVGSARNSNK